MTREDAILWLQVLKHSKINWVGEQAEDEDIIARCEEAEQEAFDMAIEALHREEAEEKGYCHRIIPSNVEVVVRCKDCRHRDLFSCPLADNDFQKDEDFCSWGERKEE